MSCCVFHSEPQIQDQHQRRAAAHRDVEVHAAFVFVVADENRLHPNVGHVNGSREEEEDGEPGEQEADQDRC